MHGNKHMYIVAMLIYRTIICTV